MFFFLQIVAQTDSSSKITSTNVNEILYGAESKYIITLTHKMTIRLQLEWTTFNNIHNCEYESVNIANDWNSTMCQYGNGFFGREKKCRHGIQYAGMNFEWLFHKSASYVNVWQAKTIWKTSCVTQTVGFRKNVTPI